MKMALFLVLSCSTPLLAQFRSITLTIRGIECASCIESLPDRLRRLRGVETVELSEGKHTVTVQLADKNRVRLEQIRDLVEQDGTKAVKASVVVSGEVSRSANVWMVEPPGVGKQYLLEDTPPALTSGTKVVRGEVADLHPDTGQVTIRVSRMD